VKKLADIKDWHELIDEVVCGDCLEGMKLIPDKSIDLVLTDPPYGMGKDFGNDSDVESEMFYAQLETVFFDACRCLKDGGLCISFFSTRLVHRLYEVLKNADFEILRGMTLYKPNDCTFPWRGWLLKSEAIVIAKKAGETKWPEIKQGEYSHDTYRFNHAGGELWKGAKQPSVKPVRVIQDFISKCSFPDDLILDPFMGSWTTARACKDLNRRFIGFELSEDYCKIDEERLKQQNLF
jgi:site-specific DNA-methyltransferase (adenine-specific)